MAAAYAVDDVAVYRSGPKGTSFLVEVTAVSGSMVAIQAIDADGDPDTGVTLLCCSGVPDDYGVLGELLLITGTTDVCSEIFKAECTDGVLSIELYNPIVAEAEDGEASITLADGTVILVTYDADADAGVYVTVPR